MKKLLTLALALIVLIAFTGLSVAQKAEQRKPTVGEKRIDKPSPKLMTGKVIQVNEKEKTFTVVAKGKEYKFVFQKIEALPKIGEIIDVTYTENPGGPMEATNLNSSRSNIY
jgi:hypothetical protein